jgi:lipoate-protein ligase B
MDLGILDYAAGKQLQQELAELRARDEIPDVIITLEHPPCITLGRGASREHVLGDEYALAAAGIEVYLSDRGGDVTYHGPGQLVVYPILDLGRRDRDVHAHARRLEQVMLAVADEFGVTATRKPGLPGIWTEGGKLGAIGITVRRWITTHGAALNLSPDLDHFSLVVPCGLRGTRTTSLEEALGYVPDAELARGALRESCEEVFSVRLADADPELSLTAAQQALAPHWVSPGRPGCG